MNNYIRMIGSMLILVYTLSIIFFFLDRIFTNIIYFQGMLYTQIIGVPAFIFLNVVVILACIIMGSIVAYSQNEETEYLTEQIEKINQGEPLSQDKSLSLEASTLYQAVLQVDQRINDIKRQSQSVINDAHQLNEEIVKQIVESERQRLARELHDSVSQQLFAASMMLSALKSATTETKVQQQLNLLEKMIQDCQLEMRALLLHLRPLGLKNKTLKQGISDLVLELKQKIPLNVNTSIEEVALKKGVEDHLFRILQEAISNTLRHAKATTITIELFKVNQSVILRIVDDGVGFDMNAIDDTRYGLNTMKERALEIGGACHIVSMKNSGTRIEVKVGIEE